MDSDRDAPRRSFLFSFGIERLGLVALKAPLVSALLIAVLTALAAWSTMHIKVDDSLSELFRTNSEEFRRYEEIDRRFPSSEYDVLVVVEGKDLLSRERLENFAGLTTELQLVDGVSGLVSMLSARDKPDATGYAPPLVPDDLPEDDAAFANIVSALKTNDIVKGKFLSDDGELALIVIALDRNVVEQRGARAVIGDINEAATRELEGSGLTAKLTGAPVMQLEIRNAVERDRLVYNGLGFLVGIGIAYLFFRRISLTLIAVAGPAIAILWTLGMIGAMDFRLNLFINVITPLILVSGFSDSMHLVMSIRRDVLAGISRLDAARHAVLDVAPACLLTAMNAALAIVSFQFADSALIRTFGKAALMAVGISYLAVAVVVPTLAALLVRDEKATGVDPRVEEEGGVGVLQRITDAIVRTVAANAKAIFALSIVAVILCGVAYAQLKPHYRLADQVPDKEQALAATGRIDAKLTGANPVHIMIRWTGNESLFDPSTMAAIAQAHDAVEQRVGLGNVWSLESLRRWLAAAGDASIENVKKYVGILPDHLVRRFIAADEKSVLVTARLPDVDAGEILPIVDKL
ncbi:MAG TPA: MMPL family transporter, partial [Hyphomicrobium sp.]|nr:MMPL family transporter [Hyphomicrobium sp.]